MSNAGVNLTRPEAVLSSGQFGFKLEPMPAPVDVLVIDNAEQPTDD